MVYEGVLMWIMKLYDVVYEAASYEIWGFMMWCMKLHGVVYDSASCDI